MTNNILETAKESQKNNLHEPIDSPSRECIHQMLRTQVAFRRALQRSVNRHHYGITFEMFQVLSILWYEEGITQQEIARRTSKNKASMTSLMNNLEKREYVYREEGEADRRNKLVYLTDSGRALKDKVMPGVYEVYSSIEKELGKNKLNKTLDFLCKIENALMNY